MIYTEYTTKMYAASNKLGWALRDKKPEEAQHHLAVIEECCVELRKYLGGTPHRPVAMCERMLLCEDTFDSLEQVMPALASVGIKGLTPAMAAHNAALEITRLRQAETTLPPVAKRGWLGFLARFGGK